MPGNEQYGMPLSDVQLNEQTARVSAALPAAGAWDTAPLELMCPTFDTFTLFCSYSPVSQSANAFELKIEVSRDGSNWYQAAVYAGGAVPGAADVVSRFQREILLYAITQLADRERMVLGPLAIAGAPDYIRITARESTTDGDVDNPGILEVLISFK